MNILIKLEYLAAFILSFFGTVWHGYDWWLFFALLLLPDLGMIGYLINTKIGAITYNLTHHQGIAFIILAIGYFMTIDTLILAGIILFGHLSMDRMLGYGLKYPDDFKHTHMGWIGQK